MAINLKYKDDNGILQISMSPTDDQPPPTLTNPQFDTINNRFSQYDLFGAKYESGDSPRSLFSSRYNSVEEELANTPYAFSTERLRLNNIDISISASPSKDIEDDRFFNRNIDLFGASVDETPAFTVTQLIHAQDRYFDLSKGDAVGVSEGVSDKLRTVTVVDESDDAFTVLSKVAVPAAASPVISISKKKKESSFAIITETPVASRPSSPRSLPVEIRIDRVSPFKGKGFREETSRHTTPKTSATNSRTNSPPRRRTHSLSRIDKMAQTVTLPPPIHFNRSHSPRDFVQENIDEVRGLSELNRERHEAEAEQKRIEEEEAILKEMGLIDKNGNRSKSCSRTNSRTNSRSNSPSKIKLRSRSNSPSAILHFENLPANNKSIFNKEDGLPKPVTHRSRIRSVSKSQPQSNEGSPKHSKIPKRQSSVSPTRKDSKRDSNSRNLIENGFFKNQRFISNSTSSIHESIRIGSQVHDKRSMSKSTQLLNITPAHIRGKPPIFPGRGGPPPSNRVINPKRLSPIVGTPNKSPTDDRKPSSAKSSPKPSPVAKKPAKTAGNTPVGSRLTSRQPSRAVSRDPSPDKKKTVTKPITNNITPRPGNKSIPNKPISRSVSTKVAPKPSVTTKPESKKSMNRTSSVKSLTRASSTKTLNERPPLNKKDSKKDLMTKAQSTNKINEIGENQDTNKNEKSPKKASQKPKSSTNTDNKTSKKENETKQEEKKTSESSNVGEEVMTQDNETQYDKITNEKGELVILTKKNIVSMTTAAITSQPLEVVTTVTNQLPATFEKAREKGIFERLNSRDSIAPGDDEKDTAATEDRKVSKTKSHTDKIATFGEDSVKLRPLQPPYNNPQVERVKQKIDSILKEQPEVSSENIIAAAKKETKTFKKMADQAKNDIKEAKNETATKLVDLKDQVVKLNEKVAAEVQSEATKIVESIMTPVEEPKLVEAKVKEEIKKDIEPIVTVVNEKKKYGPENDGREKMTEALVKGEPDLEVQSSNLSSPGGNKMAVRNKMADGNVSDKSSQSNGGFPTSTSTTPKPPARSNRQPKEDSPNESKPETKPPNICQRLMGKCKSSCPCIKGEEDETKKIVEEKKGFMNKFSCYKRKEDEDRIKEIERAAGKASIEFENETKRKRKFRDVICCKRQRRVSDVSEVVPRHVSEALAPGAVGDTGCCGRRRQEIERRDSILSDRPPTTCCNNRLCLWIRGACRRNSDHSTSSRRPSMFSKNKSLSPTLPPEDTRKKLDPSLVEHTSMMRGAIPVLPIVVAYLCLICNILVPGLGTILSGMFCLCFGIPRFGVHDGAKHRIGSLVINLLTGCGQLFTVLFCLVGWGWSVWWGVIMLNLARKYRKLKAEAAAAESEAPPVTTNNHTRA